MSFDTKKLNIVLASLFLGLLAALYFLVPSFAGQVKEAVSLLAHADIIGMRVYINSFGIWGPVVSMGLMVLQALAAPLPAFVITFANAWIFGWVMGAVYSWTGAMIGASICYFLAKAYGRPLVEKLVGKKSLAMTDQFFEKYGRDSVMIARLLPVVPFDIISYAAGLTTMGFWEFFWATGLGQLPATIVYSWLGENMSPTAKYALWAVCGFLILLVFSLAIKNRMQSKLAQSPKAQGEVELMRDKTMAETIKQTMEQGGNCCEALLAAMSSEWGIPLSADMQAAAGFFGQGMHSGCTCGALVGMMMASGMVSSRSPHPLGNKLANRLHDRFKEEFGATCCRVILKKRPVWQKVGRQGCINLTTRAWEILVQEWKGVADGDHNIGYNTHTE